MKKSFIVACEKLLEEELKPQSADLSWISLNEVKAENNSDQEEQQPKASQQNNK